jgi:hypothetical protein
MGRKIMIMLRRNPGVLTQLSGCYRRPVREPGILASTECSCRSSTHENSSKDDFSTLAPPP